MNGPTPGGTEDKIMESNLYLNGLSFKVRSMAAEIGVKDNLVSSCLTRMSDHPVVDKIRKPNGKVEYRRGAGCRSILTMAWVSESAPTEYTPVWK